MISLCIITKGDEELDGVKRAVKSCVEFVDQVNITASAKHTRLKKWCEKNKYDLSYRKWDDHFDRQRNFNYSKAKYNQFFIDSDDVVINPENLRIMDEAMKEGDVDWFSMPYMYAKDKFGRVTVKQVKPRLTRKGTGRWEQPIHECYEPTSAVNHIEDNSVVIDHLPSKNHQEVSSVRNLNILMAEYRKSGKKTDPRMIFEIGKTYAGMYQFETALAFLVEYLGVSGWDEDKFFAFHTMVDCFYSLKKYDQMVDSALNMIKLKPEWNLGYFDLARAYSSKGDYKNVIEWISVGFSKKTPKTMNFTNDLEYEVMPLGLLADAYLMTNKYVEARKIAHNLFDKYPEDPMIVELKETCDKTVNIETFVKSMLNVITTVRKHDRIKAVKLFDNIPHSLDSDYRIQQARHAIVPPYNFEDNSVVIYCGEGIGENWAYPSIFTGIGGSETAVIRMSEQLTRLGYKVTVYNNCGEMRGNYNGVEYKPFYFFSKDDNFNTLIAWRVPALFNEEIRAKKKIVWLHDIAYPQQFNKKIIKNTDKFIFLSKWHRNNMPSIPDNKIFISNNGIEPEQFKEKKEKKPYSMFWGSSYDRGLLPFVKNIFPLIKKELPKATLDVYYGWGNIDKEKDKLPELKKLREELTPLLESTEGVTEHGRIGQNELADVMKETLCYPYASEFGETNNITSQACQASDCYVITTSQAGGTPERIKFGKVIKGNNIYTDKKLQEKFAKEVVSHLKDPKKPLESVVEAFSWETTAKTWEKGLL